MASTDTERAAATPVLSVVVPAYNEQEVLPEFHRRLTAVLAGLTMASEIIYINDGSRDETLLILRRLRAEDPRVAIIDLSRNFGKEIAVPPAWTRSEEHTSELQSRVD